MLICRLLAMVCIDVSMSLAAGISSLAFNFDGSLLAIASSYTFEEGEKEYLYCMVSSAHSFV